VLGLEWSRIDLSRGVITLASRSTKSKRRREIPMRQAVYDLLAGRKDRQGYLFARRGWDGYRTAFETIAAKVVTAPEGEPLTFHGLRHHFASWFMMPGGRLEALSKILGHATLTMTMRYSHLSPDYLRSEMAKTEAPRAQGEQEHGRVSDGAERNCLKSRGSSVAEQLIRKQSQTPADSTQHDVNPGNQTQQP
jgi:integrase